MRFVFKISSKKEPTELTVTRLDVMVAPPLAILHVGSEILFFKHVSNCGTAPAEYVAHYEETTPVRFFL